MIFTGNNELALHVPDVEEAERFYAGIMGFIVVERTAGWTELSSGVLRLFLVRDGTRTHEAVVPSFSVPNRQLAIEQLVAAGCHLVPVGPHSPDGYYVRAPNGVLFDVIERP